MLCQNVSTGSKVQQEYVGHAVSFYTVAILYSIGYSWGYTCLVSVDNKY